MAATARTITMGLALSASCARSAVPPPCVLPTSSGAGAYALRFDQLGYLPSSSRWAVVMSDGKPAPKYRVYEAASGCAVAEGDAGPRVLDTKSLAGTSLTGDLVDLGGLRAPGRYFVVLEDGSRFGPVVVDGAVYRDVLPNTLRFFGAQRCGAGPSHLSHHEPCHLFAHVAAAKSGDGIAVDDGYKGRVDRDAGPAVNVEGGWHDAGDYIKFLGTTAFVLAVDLLALRDHEAALSSARAGAAYEGLRSELRWGVDWMARMVGGAEMFHQVSGEKDHEGPWRNPADDKTNAVPLYDARPAFRLAPRRGGNLLGRAAAAFALGSVVYKDDAPYAGKLLALARTVYAAGLARNEAQSPDPPDFYQERTVDDDLALAAAELARATGEPRYRADAIAHARKLASVSSYVYWGDVGTLALLETGSLFPPASPERRDMADKLEAAVKEVAATADHGVGPGAAFRYALGSFGNGSVEQSLGAAVSCLAARRLGVGRACAEVANNQLHWLFGQNPFGLSFMIGLGTDFPKDPHHSAAQSLHYMLTGAIVGGPTTLRQRVNEGQRGPVPNRYDKWSTSDLFYEDHSSDYVTNEPAIDFTAPLVYVLAELLE